MNPTFGIGARASKARHPDYCGQRYRDKCSSRDRRGDRFGDILTVVGDPRAIAAVGEIIGNRPRALQDTQMVPALAGIALGVVVGSLRRGLPDPHGAARGDPAIHRPRAVGRVRIVVVGLSGRDLVKKTVRCRRVDLATDGTAPCARARAHSSATG